MVRSCAGDLNSRGSKCDGDGTCGVGSSWGIVKAEILHNGNEWLNGCAEEDKDGGGTCNDGVDDNKPSDDVDCWGEDHWDFASCDWSAEGDASVVVVE